MSSSSSSSTKTTALPQPAAQMPVAITTDMDQVSRFPRTCNKAGSIRFRPVRTGLVIGLCVGLALLLSACAYPGQDPPCVGANKNAEGCADPVQKIVDDQNGGPWYVSWALDIVRSILSSVAINAVRLGISVFWQVFTNLSSTDFAACTSGGGGSSNPTCSAANVFARVNTVAVLFLPVIMFYKIFKSYFLGGLIEPLHEGFLSFFPKILLGGFVMYFLAVIFSGAFGISNILFDTIIGGAQSLNDISKNLLGDCGGGSVCGSGIGSVGSVKNIGLLLFMTVICLVASVVFIVLGLVFFLRTILIFILFALSPLAVAAGLTEEFKPWFGRWLGSVQAMLIAPIPVAICFALVKAFTGAIPSAQGDPAGFILQLVYIISFLTIGAILMFKIAGEVGGLAFGLAAAGLGTVAGYGVGAALGKSGGNDKSDSSQVEGSSGAGTTGEEAKRKSSGSSSGGISSASSTGSAVGSSGLPGGGSLPALASSGMAMSSAGADQQQRQLLNALRSLNESMSASAMARPPLPVQPNRLPAPGSSSRSGGGNFAHNTAFNVQSGLLWAGSAAGINAPYFRLGPQRGSTNVSGYPHGEAGPTLNQHNNFFSIDGGNTNPGQSPGSQKVDLAQEGPGVGSQGLDSSESSFAEPVRPASTRQSTGGVVPAQGVAPAYPTAVSQPTMPVKEGVQGSGGNNYQPQPVSPAAAPVNQPARRVKISGVIPDPYGASGSKNTFVTGSASAVSGSNGNQQP